MTDDNNQVPVNVPLDEKRTGRHNKKITRTPVPEEEYSDVITAEYSIRGSVADEQEEIDEISDLYWNKLTFREYMEGAKYRSEVYQDKGGGNKRNYRHSMYADALMFKAVRKLNDLGFAGSGNMQSSFIFEVIMLGYNRIFERSYDTFASVRDLVRTMDDDPHFEGAPEMIADLNINQRGGSITEVKVSFYHDIEEQIRMISKDFGITKSSFLVACFWEGAIACEELPIDLMYYGQDMIKQFNRIIKMKLGVLKLLHEIYKEEHAAQNNISNIDDDPG